MHLSQNLYILCAIKSKFAHTLCTFKPKFAHTLCANKPCLKENVAKFVKTFNNNKNWKKNISQRSEKFTDFFFEGLLFNNNIWMIWKNSDGTRQYDNDHNVCVVFFLSCMRGIFLFLVCVVDHFDQLSPLFFFCAAEYKKYCKHVSTVLSDRHRRNAEK